MSAPEIINALQTKIANCLNVALPAVIEDYNFKEQRASVKITIKQLYAGDTDMDYPILSGVPVIFPRSGGASITMPVQRGDHCLLVFLDRDSRAWLLGGVNVKPQSKRSHHLSDAVAIPGLSPFSKLSLAENNTDMLINFDGSKIRLKPKGIVDIETAKEVNVKTEKVVINCKNAEVKASENVTIQAKTTNITTSESANIKCQNANIEASGDINTKAISFIQTGDMKITGNVKIEKNIEVIGTSKLTGNVDSDATIKGSAVKAGSIDLATHTHRYSEPAIGSSPTAATPGTTGTAN